MKFNKNVSTRTLEQHPARTTNLAGGVAYKLDDKTELYQRVATCLVNEPKYYEKPDETTKAIVELVQRIATGEPEFVLKLACYARHKLNLRSVPMLLLGEAVLNTPTRKFVRHYTPYIISRADEMSEILAYLQAEMGDFGNHKKTGMLPNSIKKGIADTFGRFSEYQLQKYEQSGAGKVKLRDVLRLTHPKPVGEQSALWKRLREGKLEVADTWETRISSKGSTKENWEEAALKMPIMATLRNLRNLLDKEVKQDILKQVMAKLTNKDIILKSKQFPFRFFSAYKAIENCQNDFTKYMMQALETAMDISCANLPKIPGMTGIFADISASMDVGISEKSQVLRKEVACMMLAIADKCCEFSGTATFSSDVWPFNLNPRNGLLTNMQEAMRHGNSSETYTFLCLEQLRTKVDRVLIFTDQQDYGKSYYYSHPQNSLGDSLAKYRQSYSPNCYLYSCDLAGYGTSSIPQDDAKSALIAGWSERILEFILAFEGEKSTAVEAIDNYKVEEKEAAKHED